MHYPVDARRKLNVHKTFNLRPVSISDKGLSNSIISEKKLL